MPPVQATEEPLRRLRDRTAITRLLIVAELQRRPGGTLSDVADALGITVQAVSVHARALAASGFLHLDDGSYQVSPKGLQSLHEGVRNLHEALNDLAAPLDVIQVTSAVAASSIAAGQSVGLYMEDGDLAARPSTTAPSRGKARNAAKAGDEVIVAHLQGMVRLEPGRLTLVSLPGPAEGGIGKIDRPGLTRLLQGRTPAKVGAHGTGARILARSLAKDGFAPLDFEFAADRAAFNAAERGLGVLLFVTRDRLPEVMEAMERLNAGTLRRVTVELVEAPEHA
ncbi:MAG: winged helix-turn-helix transcriptional regulator [Candidatus Thermoplasmatota archaeon]